MNTKRGPILRPGQDETREIGGNDPPVSLWTMEWKPDFFYSSCSQLSPDVKDKTDILSTHVSNIYLKESMFWLTRSSPMAGTNIF